MFGRIALLVTLLTVAAVSAADPAPKPVTKLVKARRACKSQKALICYLTPVSGSSVSGKVLFTPAFRVVANKPQCAVRVRAMVSGLTGRKHGFHIHTYGDISSMDGTSTGPHFLNPLGEPIDHGLPDDEIRHWGDFGNLRMREGTAKYNRVDKVISLEGIVGRGITIHEGRDMGAPAQPTGDSGSRKAVCVIGFANPSSLSSPTM